MNPILSIIMPTYNRENFLKESISSILAQTFTQLELIIIDDASTDKTKELVASFSDSRIRYFRMEQNYGEYWCTNYGANLATAPYLTWVHSDDVIPKSSFEERIKVMQQNSNLDFVHGDVLKIDVNGNPLEVIEAVEWPREKIVSEYLVQPDKREKEYLIHHLTILMKWNFFYKAGPFDASLPFAGDIDWLIRAIRIGNFQKIHSVLYWYRYHSGARRVVDIENGVNKNAVFEMIARRYR